MIAHVRALAAALMTPVWVAGGRWRALLEPRSGAAAAAAPAIRTAERAVGWLSRLPRSPWRATCLYRGVAVCLLLRWSGVAAVLRLGVAKASSDTLAHAWIESATGELLYGVRSGWAPLERPSP